MRSVHDGMTLWYGTPDAPAPSGFVPGLRGNDPAPISLIVAVQPPSASNSVEVTYRIDGGSVTSLPATLLTHDPYQMAQYFIATFPPLAVGQTVDYFVVGRSPGHQVPGPAEAGHSIASFEVVSGIESGTNYPYFAEASAPPPLPAQKVQRNLPGVALTSHPTIALGSTAGHVATPVATHSAGSTGVLTPATQVGYSPSTTAQGATGSTVSFPTQTAGDSPGATQSLGAAPEILKPEVLVAALPSLQRIPHVIDPLSLAGGQLADHLLPFRAAAYGAHYERVESEFPGDGL